MTPDELARACTEVMWADDPASQSLGMQLLEVAEGRAVLSMKVRDDMVNGHGIGHGGSTFSLADSAFAFACNTRNVRTVAQSCLITYVGPTRLGDELVAEAVERSVVGRTGVYDVTVRRGDELVAEFRGTSRTIGGTLVDPS